MAGHPDPESFVADFSGTDRTVAEYLLAEMLERQPDDVRQLLLRTSLLDRVNGELADVLTGRPGSERTLLDLEDANAFVVSLDPQRTWFRYHHLFADLLKLELRRTVPEEVPALHRRAAGWLLEHGQIVDAIRHTQAAGDWTTAAHLLADHSFGLTLDGRTQTIQMLLRAFLPARTTIPPTWPSLTPRPTSLTPSCRCPTAPPRCNGLAVYACSQPGARLSTTSPNPGEEVSPPVQRPSPHGPAPALFVIEIDGHLGATVLSAFPGLTSQSRGGHTLLTGLLDQSGLYGVLAQIEALGLGLVEIHQVHRDCDS